MDPRLPFNPPRSHGEEIANAFAQRGFDDAIHAAHVRKIEAARNRLGVVLIIFICAAITCAGIGLAVARLLDIQI